MEFDPSPGALDRPEPRRGSLAAALAEALRGASLEWRLLTLAEAMSAVCVEAQAAGLLDDRRMTRALEPALQAMAEAFEAEPAPPACAANVIPFRGRAALRAVDGGAA